MTILLWVFIALSFSVKRSSAMETRSGSQTAFLQETGVVQSDTLDVSLGLMKKNCPQSLTIIF